MATRIVWIPGVMGSSLGVRAGGGGPVVPVWVEPLALLSGAIVQLQLAADGASPGPLAKGATTVVEGIFQPAYGEFPAFLETLGYQVLRLGYDWRRDVVSVAALAWPIIAAWAGSDPVNLVGHSLGGLLARAIYGQALAAGAGGQVAKIITIGTPHYGTVEAVRLFWRLPILYRGISKLCGWGAREIHGAGQDWLDATLATHPAWYQLLPWFASGPLFLHSPAQATAIYTLPFYQGGNGYVMPSWLQLAQVVQGEMAAWLPAGKLTSIAGVGWNTTEFLDLTQSQNTDAGYTYTQQGDGLVTLAAASPVGASVVQVATQHALQPLDPAVWAVVVGLVGP